MLGGQTVSRGQTRQRTLAVSRGFNGTAPSDSEGERHSHWPKRNDHVQELVFPPPSRVKAYILFGHILDADLKLHRFPRLHSGLESAEIRRALRHDILEFSARVLAT